MTLAISWLRVEILIAFPPLSDPTSVSSARIVVDYDVLDVDNDDQPRH